MERAVFLEKQDPKEEFGELDTCRAWVQVDYADTDVISLWISKDNEMEGDAGRGLEMSVSQAQAVRDHLTKTIDTALESENRTPV